MSKRVVLAANSVRPQKTQKVRIDVGSAHVVDERSESISVLPASRVRVPAYTRTRPSVGVRSTPEDARTRDGFSEMLEAMSADERQELMDELSLRSKLSAKQVNNPDLDMWALAVKTALDRAIGGGAGDSYGSLLVKAAMGSPQVWRPVENFMQASRLMEQTRPTRLAVYMLFAQLLVDDCKGLAEFVDAPLSVKFVANNVGNLAGVVDKSFPGYAANGLLPMVAKQMQMQV